MPLFTTALGLYGGVLWAGEPQVLQESILHAEAVHKERVCPMPRA
jgi:hypothetical protein